MAKRKNSEIIRELSEQLGDKIDGMLDTLRKQQATWKEKDGAVEAEDRVTVDFTGSVDGEEFEGGNTNGAGYDLTIGSDAFIEGFEDQLIGANVGDMVTVNVTFPEGYTNEDVAGKDAEFDCTINGIYELDTFDDDLIPYHDQSSFKEPEHDYMIGESSTFTIDYQDTAVFPFKIPCCY